MYLKTIEVQGFKSFAQKIVFEFHNGITGIVGPNGSGKSNVADAVRWVLGEQSAKQLRGSNMQDVIFAGTQNRKPQGYAYVAITFDNQDRTLSYDADEVTVSRRVYRSGESEYQLNSAGCRLRDIQELFYDTGIGKEGYSIIGQGQIDRILSTKPEERRELFDEAAGIVKFKKRKALAEKKLESEKQNLIRVQDILSELEKQVGPLEKQAEKAKHYLALKEQLKGYEINRFLHEEEKGKEQKKELEQKIQIVGQDLSGTKLNAEVQKKRHETLEQKREELEREISRGMEGIHQKKLYQESLEGKIGVLQEQIHTGESTREHLTGRMEAISREQENRKKEKEGFTGQKTAVSKQLDQLEDEQAGLRGKIEEKDKEIRSMDEKVAREKEGMLTAMNDKASLMARQQRYEAMEEQSRIRQSEVNARLLKFKTEEGAILTGISKKEQEISRIEEEGKSLLLERDRIQKEEEELERQERKAEENLAAGQREYHMISSRLESLRNLAERYEGYGNSVKKVMERSKNHPGVMGVVADLLTVAPEYETAIETALGGTVQNIVTRDEKTAGELITYLKENRFGRATFLPLSAIKAGRGFAFREALKEEGVLGTADSLVEVKEELLPLKEYLLGKVLVVDKMDHGMKIAGKYGHSFRMVTLEGELFQAGGSMTGGAYRNPSSLLGRKRELSQLSRERDRLQRAVNELQKELEEGRKKRTLNAGQKEELTRKLQEKQLEKNTALFTLNQEKERLENHIQNNEELLRESRQLEKQLKDIQEEKKALLSQSQSLEEEKETHSASMEEASQNLEQIRLEREALSGELSRVQAQAGALSQKDAFLLENILRIKGEMDKAGEEYQGLERQLSETEQSAEDLVSDIGALKEEICRTKEELKELSAQVEEYQSRKELQQKEQKGFYEKREELLSRINSLEKELYRLEGQKEKLEEQSLRQTQYLWEEYGLTPSEASAFRDDSIDSPSRLSGKIGELKEKIKALGNVNVNAIEDYKETSARYAFLKGQHEDLTGAANKLKEVISGLEEGMRAQFEKKFKEIKIEFDRVFKELFGGGQGSLELLESEDVLEAGIQIIAQPPGKKLQNMMQLSGGEKALTAISLLFAIQRLRPSPFCLLDEIEAALDDVNVNRFANYLDKLKEKIQFIVITHRRGTMTVADRLYGITMQEKGVSSLVSVDLTGDGA